MAYFADEFLYEMADPCQFMHWDKEDRPYHLMGMLSDQEDEGIPGEVLELMLKSKKAKSESRPCKYYQKGNCRFGNACRFVHGYRERNDDEMAKCIFFQKGYCRYGDDCKFKHGEKAVPKPIRTSQSEVSPEQVSSPFSPSDEDLKAGRLTRLRMCLDIPVTGSVKNPKPLHHGAYYIEVFVNKREDSVQYLYDVLVEKANHPMYQMGMFELCKPGTNCDLSVSSMNLKDTSLFIFGSCVEVVLKQSFKLASVMMTEIGDAKEDERRYSASKLPRNANGTFEETNLRSLMQDREVSDDNELFPKGCLSMKVGAAMFENCGQPAKHFEVNEKFSKYVKTHDKSNCQWCIEMGCNCLADTVEQQVDSDDSEWSTDSKSSSIDQRKTRMRRKSSGGSEFSCGAFPDCIDVKSILDILQKSDIVSLSFGDMITFGEYCKDSTYVLGKNDRLIKIAGPNFLEIPFEVSMYLKDALKKYNGVLQQKKTKANDTIGIYLRHDDAALTKAFGNELPTAWKYCLVVKYGASVSDLSSTEVQYVKVEFDKNNSINVVSPEHQLAKDGRYLTRVPDMVQKFLSCKEKDDFVSFDIELSLKDKERERLVTERGMLEPRILTWFITATNHSDPHNRMYNFKGPKEEVEIVKGIVEEFYEGFSWRYGRMKST